MFNLVALYRYLIPTVYLSVADIVNPDLFGCRCLTWIYVVVRLPRPMEGKVATPMFNSLQKLSVPPPAGGVVGTLYCAFFPI